MYNGVYIQFIQLVRILCIYISLDLLYTVQELFYLHIKSDWKRLILTVFFKYVVYTDVHI